MRSIEHDPATGEHQHLRRFVPDAGDQRDVAVEVVETRDVDAVDGAGNTANLVFGALADGAGPVVQEEDDRRLVRLLKQGVEGRRILDWNPGAFGRCLHEHSIAERRRSAVDAIRETSPKFAALGHRRG